MSTYRPIAERARDFDPVEIPLAGGALEKELRRCQDCGIPFCHASGCPPSQRHPRNQRRGPDRAMR